MSCLLTKGFPLDCRDAVGGVKAVRFASLAQWNALDATVASGEVTNFGSASTVFYKYEQLKETSFMNDGGTGSLQAGTWFYTPTLTILIPKLQASVDREIKLLAQNRLVALVETNDGVIKVLGAENGIEVITAGGGSGTAFGDFNGYTIAFEGREKEPSYTISLALADTVTNA